MSKENEFRTALLISGGGSTAEAVIKACQEGRLRGISPVCVISSRTDAPGIQKAEALGIKTFQVSQYPEPETFGSRLMEILQRLRVDLVSQNGWLPKTPPEVVMAYSKMIINQHPGPLDPDNRIDFGGKGMYGSRVTAAVLAYMWAIGEEHPYTESTIHRVTAEYDRGSLISINRLDIPSFGRPITIAELAVKPDRLIKVTSQVQSQLLPLEHSNVISVLQAFVDGNVPTLYRTTRLILEENSSLIQGAKLLGQRVFPHG